MTSRKNFFTGPFASALTWRVVIWVTLPPLMVIAISALGLIVGYPVFHAVAELFSIAIALAAMLVASTSHRFRKNDLLVYLGIAIGWCAVIDLWHTLTFKGMGLFPGDSANPPTQLWIAARYLQAFGMVTAPLFLRRRAWVGLVHGGFGLVVAVLLALIAYGKFPDAYIDGQGLTPFKIYSEYVIIAMLAASVYLLWRSRALLPRQMLLGLCIAAAAMMLSELAFTRYVSVYASANLVGHLFKIIAYWFIFIGMVEWTLREPFELLSESAARYQRTVDGANDGIWEWVPATGEDYLSPRFKRLLGFAENEVPNVQGSFFDRIHPEDAERVRKAVDDHLVSRTPYAVDLRLQCKDGSYRWFYARGEAQWDDQGKPLLMSGSITDIEQLKQVQADLQQTAVELRERGKELRCLNELLSLGYPDPLPLDELLRAAVRVMPQGWLHNDIACARIDFEGRAFITDNFRETPWALSAELVVAGRSAGRIEVFYLEERPSADVGPFLNEEVTLIESIASQLGAKIGRLRADEKLRDSEAMLSAIVNAAPSGITVIRMSDRKIIQVNAAAQRLLGYAQEEMIGKTALELGIFPRPEQRDEVLRILGKTGRVDQFRVDYRTKQGEQRVMEYSGRVVVLHGDQCNVGMWQDVTERVRVDDLTRQSEARFRQMFEGNSSVLLLVEPESGAIIDANAAAANFYGYPADRLKTMRIDEINTLGVAETLAERRNAVAQKRNYFIFPHRLASGEVRTVEVRSSPIEVDGGVHLFSIVTDVTELKKAEVSLQESEAKLRTIFDTMSEGVALNELVFDASGEAIDYRILDVNKAFYATADYAGSEVKGRLASDVYGMSAETIRAFWREHRGRTEVQRTEFLSPLKQRVFYIVTSPFFGDRFVTTFMDITERKQAEEVLIQRARELAERNEELTRFSQVAVDRELRMLELKQEVNDLCARIGESPRYQAGADGQTG